MHSMAYPRVVDWIDGAINLRDFGGYPTTHGRMVRSGVLFRSGSTHGIATEGLARLAEELRIRSVIDLRSERERTNGSSAFEQHGIDVVHEHLDTGFGDTMPNPGGGTGGDVASHEPTVDQRDAVVRSMALGEFDWGQMYWTLLHRNPEHFARILAVVADADRLPVLVHCAGGRDRTGVTVALIQAAVGVVDDAIAEDFALSSQLMELGAPAPEFERLFGGVSDVPRERIVEAMATRPETMHALLARIRDKYGSVSGLLQWLGVSDAAIGDLRATLLA
jgi:protein-tyrosine phosphatase